MDIRSFFGGGKKQQPASALSAVRASATTSPASAATKTPQPQETKKRAEKVRTKKEVVKKDEVEEFLSDAESPIPKSLKKEVRAAKRKPVVVSDSDDDFPPSRKTKASRNVSASPSPKKKSAAPSRKKVIISSGSEASPSPKKRRGKIRMSSSDDSIVLFDDDEEPIPATKRKGVLPPGQKRLTLTAPTKEKEVKGKVPAVESGLKKVSAADFFNKGAATTTKKQPSPKKTAPKVVANDEFVEKATPSPSAAEKTLPKQRTPKKVVPKGADCEFLEEEDIVPEESSKKKDRPLERKEETTKKQKKSPAKKSGDDEFVESDDDDFLPVKKSKPSPSSKENVPMKKKATPEKKKKEVERKEKEGGEKESKELPMRIAGSPERVVEEKTYELPWVDKYKPASLSQLVGQHGDKSPMNKLLAWLKDWAKHNLGEGAKTKKPKPAPWATGGDGTPFKAALLSGTPGVGKTTCAQMACQQLGLKFVEMNASDVRNKKHLEGLVAEMLGSHHIDDFMGKNRKDSHDSTEVHTVLIMDEVDGMSGNEDRAGIAELIQMIKDTKIPIVCICNDRQHPKIRSLGNYCYDLRFPKPRVEQIRSRIMSIAAQEKMRIGKEELDELIELSGHDVRQTIYNLQMRSTSGDSKIEKKDCAINTFEAARRLLSNNSSWMEKQEMFFTDYGIMPLFVQENYVNMKNKKHSKEQSLKCIREAADFISLGDTVDRCIRSSGAWKLLNEQSMFSAVLPTVAVDGYMSGMIQFPSWLGKNSTAGKRQRLMRQLACHAHLKISADTHSLVTDYVPVLRRALTDPLLHQENEGVPAVVDTMNTYDLLKDDAEAIGELAVWPGKIDPASKIPSKVKAALTRALNKEHRTLPYHLEEVSKGRRKGAAAAAQAELEVDEEGNVVERVEGEEEPEEEEDEKDTPPPTTTSGSRGGRGGAAAGGGARGGGRGRGRGKK